MKTLYGILSTVFLTVGACIGAGFITGRETVTFFGTENFLPYLIFSCILLAVCLFIVFVLGSKFSSLTVINGRLFKHKSPFDIAVKISAFLSISTMLSAIDAFTKPLNFLHPFPLFSVIILAFISIVSRFGVNGARVINFIIMPVALILVNLIAFSNGRMLVSATPVQPVGFVKAFLFVALNIFMNLPSFVDGARDKPLWQNGIIALLSSIIIVVQAGVILATIKGYGMDISNTAMPFFTAINNPSLTLIFSIVCVFSIITSLLSAYYPLYEFSKSKLKKGGGITLMVVCLLFSRLGIKNIVDYAYPLIGAFGTVYLIKCIIFLVKEKWKSKITLSLGKNRKEQKN